MHKRKNIQITNRRKRKKKENKKKTENYTHEFQKNKTKKEKEIYDQSFVYKRDLKTIHFVLKFS